MEEGAEGGRNGGGRRGGGTGGYIAADGGNGAKVGPAEGACRCGADRVTVLRSKGLVVCSNVTIRKKSENVAKVVSVFDPRSDGIGTQTASVGKTDESA